MKDLYLDIETFSSVSLRDCGVYRYADSEDAKILLFGYSVDGAPIEVIETAKGEQIPAAILSALSSPAVTKWAHNASFERVFLSVWLRRNCPEYFRSYGDTNDTVSDYLDPHSWKCTMVWSAYCGLPLTLEQVGAIFHLEEQKMVEGKNLIRFFSLPRKPTKNDSRIRNLPDNAPDKWATFVEYNRRDVQVEMEIAEKLSRFPVPDSTWEEYWLSEKINDRGILVDLTLAENAIRFDDQARESLIKRMKTLTKLENPNSVQQLKSWLEERDIRTDSLDKNAIISLLKTVPKEVAEVLTLRQQTSRSSVKKYTKMMDTVCADGRARGMFQFYGASRTGRWAGRHIQLQNLPQNHLDDLAEARGLVRSGDFELMSMLYDNVPDTLSQLIRTAFIPRPGFKFVVADFSSIEARVISFIAGEDWRIEVFDRGDDIYCASASQMFGVPVEKHGVNSHLRQKGKIAELALGYGGSVGALKAMGALDMGLTEDELQPLVDMWREASPNITRLWWSMDAAVKNCIKTRAMTETHGIRFVYKSGIMFMVLPSGRRLAYVKPKIEPNDYGSESVTYFGINGTSRKWERLESYGPKFVENLVQAASRDILAYTMKNLSDRFICGHVHDELILEVAMETPVEEICDIMGKTPPWIEGLNLRADGYECYFYMKD